MVIFWQNRWRARGASWLVNPENISVVFVWRDVTLSPNIADRRKTVRGTVRSRHGTVRRAVEIDTVRYWISHKNEEVAMPLYEYMCRQCGHSFEEILFHADTEVRCPRCNGPVRKLISTFNYEIPSGACAKLPRGEARERCTECQQGGRFCPGAVAA
jgi:putative FmdB family regulatory protein